MARRAGKVGLTIAALGVGILLAALTVAYRDFRYVVPFLVQLWMFASPVAYPSSLVPEGWRRVYALNPLVGIIEGFRAALLGREFNWTALAISTAVTLTLLVYAAYAFRRMERGFADIV